MVQTSCQVVHADLVGIFIEYRVKRATLTVRDDQHQGNVYCIFLPPQKN